MKNNFTKSNQYTKKIGKILKSKTINRFWGNATRLEHRNVSGKKNK